MRRVNRMIAGMSGLLLMLTTFPSAAIEDDQGDLFRVREAVWRAWFANDRKTLEELVPEGTIAISAGEEKWQNQAEIIQSAAEFQSQGGQLIRLEFPRTEMQRFGEVAILYSQYLYETDVAGKRSVTTGRVTEVFVRQRGKWTNPGWHTDAGK